jgi:1,2-dihydroxy-3-keto-5-methylthiopentene dioxygenase
MLRCALPQGCLAYSSIAEPYEQGDPRLPHASSEPVPATRLSSLGLLYQSIPLGSPTASDDLENLAKARSYKNRDEITVSPQAMGQVYEDKIKMFFHEHMHEDEEIRYILDGAGYFDVRENGDDRWVRVRLEKGDLLVLPAGIYHRFTTDENNVRLRMVDIDIAS